MPAKKPKAPPPPPPMNLLKPIVVELDTERRTKLLKLRMARAEGDKLPSLSAMVRMLIDEADVG